MLTPEEIFQREIWWMLRRLQKERFMSGDFIRVEQEKLFEPDAGGEHLPAIEQDKVIWKLKELGILDVDFKCETNYAIAPEHHKDKYKYYYVIKIHKKKFDEKYHEFEKITVITAAAEQSEVQGHIVNNSDRKEMASFETSGNNRRLFDLPENAAWSDLVIKFKDAESIEVFRKNKLVSSASYKKMGFGKKKPDQRWKFLNRLAIIYATNPNKDENGMPAAIDDIAHSLLSGVNEDKRNQIQTLRASLANQLRKAIGIDDEPFEDYKQWKFYKTKFQLLPEPNMRHEEPYEADVQMHEKVDLIDSKRKVFEGKGGRLLSDEQDFGESGINSEDERSADEGSADEEEL